MWLVMINCAEIQTFKIFFLLWSNTLVKKTPMLYDITTEHIDWINRGLSDLTDPQGSHQWRTITNSEFYST